MSVRRLLPAWLPACLAAGLLGMPGVAAPMRFVDATTGAGIRHRNVCGAADKDWLAEGMGAGAAWLDYDGDGNLDLYLVNGSTFERKPGEGEPNQLYRGDGRGRFEDVTAKAGVGHRGWGYGVTVGDYDNDGDPDLFVTNLGPNVLYRNNGDGTFSDVTAAAGVAGDPVWSSSAAFFDYDGDGDLDLYVTNYMATDTARVPRRGSAAAAATNCSYKGIAVACGPLGQVPLQDVLWRNDGKDKWSDATAAAGLVLSTPRYALGVVTADYDNDGDQDIYVANDSVQNSLWRNADGKFTDVGVVSLVALNADGRAQAGMGTDFGDYDGDGFLDLVVTNFAHDLNTLYRSLQARFFVDDSTLAGMGVTNLALSWGVGFQDFDRDGDLDLFIANGHIYPQVDAQDLGTPYRQRNSLFENGGGRFTEVTAASGPGLGVARSFRGAAFGDYDNDGDVDALVTSVDDAALLLENAGTPAGNWLSVRLVGTRSNRDGVGARVIVTAGGRSWMRQRTGGGSYLSASDPRLHFGLGAVKRIERLDVFWPSGARQTLTDLAPDRAIVVEEPAP